VSRFQDDEGKHNKPTVPISATAAKAIKAKAAAAAARPIKKVAEAKARKKFKAHRILSRIQSRHGVGEEDDDMGGEKAKELEKLMKKGLAKIAKLKRGKRVEKVVARGSAKGRKGRPKGIKGRYKMVDARQRKETRATKRIADKKKNAKR